MKLFKKNMVALAIAATAATTANAAVDYTFPGTNETIVLASEIFGDETGSGSEETLIVMDNTEFDLDSAVAGIDAAGDNMATTETATVKFTLGGAAVFGEDLSTTALVNAANGGNGAFTCSVGAAADDTVDDECGATAATNVNWEVVQGGAIGDNTITFQITNNEVGDAVLSTVTFGNVAVKNLTSALGDGGNHTTFRGRVEMGVEYVEAADGAADLIATTATDDPLEIFGSQPGLELSGTAINYTSGNNFVRINVGNGEISFTGGTADGRDDFDLTGDVSTIELGTLDFDVAQIDTSLATGFPDSNGGDVRKENGDAFDFQGGDDHNITITAASGSLQEGADIFLTDAAACGAITTGLNQGTTDVVGGQVASVVTGSTTALTHDVYNVCYTVDGASQIPEVDGIAVAWAVDFFNTRYDDQDYDFSSYGPLMRNGCIASFFNVPNSGNATDRAFIRLTNTSTTNSGDIRGTLYAEDGSVIGTADTVISGSDLDVHATAIFTSAADDVGAATSLEDAFGLSSAWSGRARLVLKGAFDTCEGLGLVRNMSTGILTNMTATTQGNEAAAPNDGNNGN